MRAQQQTVPIAALPHGAPHAVLIVHHDQQRVDALALGLADDGHRALTATTLVEARSQLASVHIDLVVVELLLGREQGLDLVAQIGPPDVRSFFSNSPATKARSTSSRSVPTIFNNASGHQEGPSRHRQSE